MTVRFSADVFCDRCGDWVRGATSNEKNALATRALKVAKAAGWSRDNKSIYLDVCPKCLDEVRKEVS